MLKLFNWIYNLGVEHERERIRNLALEWERKETLTILNSKSMRPSQSHKILGDFVAWLTTGDTNYIATPAPINRETK